MRRGEYKAGPVSPQAQWYRRHMDEPGFRECGNAANRTERAAMSPEERRASGLKKNAARRAVYAALSPDERSALAQRSMEANRLRLSALTPAAREARRLKANADQNAKRAALSPAERKAVYAERNKNDPGLKARMNMAQNATYAALSPAERKAKNARSHAGRSEAERVHKNAHERDKYKRRVAFMNTLKDAPCLDCGRRYASYVMDFDHRPGVEKVSAVGNMFSQSVDRVLEEISKCDLVCSNCHRERTRQRRGPRATSKYARQRALIDAHKAVPCLDCRIRYAPHVMDLDHRPGIGKVAGVAALLGAGAPLTRISEEIAKCDVVCSNCHRERTHRRRNS